MDDKFRNQVFPYIKNIYIAFAFLVVIIPTGYFAFAHHNFPMVVILLLVLVIMFLIGFITGNCCNNNCFWEDFSYILYLNKLKYHKSGDNETYYADYEMVRKVKSNVDGLESMTIILSKSEVSLPVRLKGDIELIDFIRDNGVVTIDKPTKRDHVSIEFKVNFNPPLKKNETVSYVLKFRGESLFTKDVEHIEKFAHSGDFEYNSLFVHRRIQECGFEIRFGNDSKVDILGCDVSRGEAGTDFPAEQTFVDNSGCFMVSKDSEGQLIAFSRVRPPVGARYTFRWIPAKQD